MPCPEAFPAPGTSMVVNVAAKAGLKARRCDLCSAPELGAIRTVFGGDPLVGLCGLLLSPGKSVFLYAPPVLAGVLALPVFWRRAHSEAVLIGLLTVSQIALVAPLTFWAGDSAWGPRYMVPLVPLLLLPLVAWLDRAASRTRLGLRALAALVGLGLLVQTVGNASNPHTYIFETGGPDGSGAQQRWFEPLASPLVASGRQLLQRAAEYVRPMPSGTLAAGAGFYPPDGVEHRWPRWTNGSAELRFRPSQSGPVTLRLELIQPEPTSMRPMPGLALSLDGRTVPPTDWHIERPAPGQYALQIRLGDLTSAEHRLLLSSPTFQAQGIDPSSNDPRLLGVQVIDASLDSEVAARLVDVPAVPRLPLSTTHHWDRSTFGWFYDPAMPHLVDIWPWYLSQSGLPPWLAWFGLVPVVAVIVLGWRLVVLLRFSRSSSQPVGLAVWLVVAATFVSSVLAMTATVGGVLVAADRQVAPPSSPAGVPACVDRCAMIAWTYRVVLGREPDVDGWLAYYSSSLDEAQLRDELCASDEGRTRGCVLTGAWSRDARS